MVKFVHLATKSDMEEETLEKNCERAVVLGWGDQYAKDSDGNPFFPPIAPYNPQLHCVRLEVITEADCFRHYGELIPENYMCTFAYGKDACQVDLILWLFLFVIQKYFFKGDSGGPLICNGTQYGIILSGIGCAYKSFPGLHTKVANYRTFIHDTMRYNSGLYYKCLKMILILNVVVTSF